MKNEISYSRKIYLNMTMSIPKEIQNENNINLKNRNNVFVCWNRTKKKGVYLIKIKKGG